MCQHKCHLELTCLDELSRAASVNTESQRRHGAKGSKHPRVRCDPLCVMLVKA